MKSLVVTLAFIAYTILLGGYEGFAQTSTPKKAQKTSEKGVTFASHKASAEAGNPVEMIHTGMCYEFGWGVARSKAEALFWYRKALENLKDAEDLSLEELEQWRNKATAGIAGVKMGE